MTKQEKIEEMKLQVGSLIIQGQMKEADKLCPTVDAIFEYLHSQGVVIKVDGQFPDVFDKESKAIFPVRKEAHVIQRDMVKAGYVAVEPLIEKK